MAYALYGYSSVLDVIECDSSMFTRVSIEAFLVALCEAIDMELVLMRTGRLIESVTRPLSSVTIH